MRSVTSGELTTLLAARVGHYLRVEIQNGAGTFVDYATLGGVDWVDRVSINAESIDQPVGTAQIHLRRRAHNLRLAPFYGGSSLNTGSPALDLGRRVRISVAAKAPGSTPSGGDWKELFSGRIDNIGWEQDPIVLDCSDEGAWLMDLQIESERDYVKLEMKGEEYGTLVTGTNYIEFSGADPRNLNGGLRPGDTVALLFMPNSANNKTITVASLTSTRINTVETLTANGSPTAVPMLSRQSTAVEHVMQKLLDDNTSLSGIGALSLYVPVAPGWQVRPYRQQRQRLLEALRALAIQIGWEVRYRYDNNNVFRLTLFEPPRTKTLTLSATATGYARSSGSFLTDGYAIGDVIWGAGFTNSVNNGAHTITNVTATDITCTGTTVESAAAGRSLTKVAVTLGPTHYWDVNRLNISLADIRNVVTGRYVSAAGNLGSASQSDTASLSKYQRRYMEISEDATSNINTQTEMQRLVDAAVNDLSEPKTDQEVSLLLLWPLQFGDFVRFLPNEEHYDSDQGFSVVGVTHEFEGGQGVTTISTRGKAAGFYADWLRREAPLFDQALNPTPTITAEAEGTANGGSGQGRGRLKIKFDALTKEVYIYAVEGASAGLAAPEQTANRLAGIVARQEGTVASATDWETEFDIGTQTSYYRKMVAIPVGFSNTRGDARQGVAQTFEVQASDTGVAPSGDISALAVTMSVVNGVAKAELSWTNGDATAEVRLFRNGTLLKRCVPGTTFFVDDGLTPDVPYTYQAQAVKNGQTGALVTANDPSLSVVLEPPANFQASGGNPANAEGDFFITLSFNNPDPLASTEIEVRDPVTGNIGTFRPGNLLGPGVNNYSYNSRTTRPDILDFTDDLVGYTFDFRGRAVRSGYEDSSWSDWSSTSFGPAF